MENTAAFNEASLSRRQLLNFLTGAVVAATVGSTLYPVSKYFVPPKQISARGGILAKDKLGHPIPARQILAEPPGTRALIAGLAGEPTYLTVQEDGTLRPEGIVNNCTHLGCTFPLVKLSVPSSTGKLTSAGSFSTGLDIFIAKIILQNGSVP